MSGYWIEVCPFCREQVDRDEDGYRGYHTHHGVDYPATVLDVIARDPSEILWAGFASACRSAEEEHARAEAKAAADRAELERMEDEWRATAPPEQIEAYEESRRRSGNFAKQMAAMLRETWTAPSVMRQFYGSSPLIATEEEIAAHRAESDRLKRQELQDELRLFEAEGPAAVSFYRLRRIRQELAELDQ